MENLKEQRLGYGYCNAKGEQMLVTEYRNNKRVVVKNVTTGTTHQCRWCDLQNVRCPAVYDASAARRRFEEEIEKSKPINTVTEAREYAKELGIYNDKVKDAIDNVAATATGKPTNCPNSARTDLTDEVIRQVKESEEWAFADDLAKDYDEGNGGCASVAVASSIVLVVVGLLAWLLI